MIILASAVGLPPDGGVPVLNRLLIEAAASMGKRPFAVALHDRRGDKAGEQGYVVRGCGGSRMRFLMEALRIRQRAELRDILVSHVSLAPAARLARVGRQGRVFSVLLGVEAWRPLDTATRWGMRRVDGAISISAFTLERFRAANPRLADLRATVMHLPARTLPCEGEPYPRGVGPRVLIVGRLWGRGLLKGQSLLIDVWSRVLQRVPGAELWIVGGGAGAKDLSRRAEVRGVGGAVCFKGLVSEAELDRCYRSCDVYAMPSKGEGFGLVFAEAMARGLPCIASRFDAGSEVVEDLQTGLLVDPDDEEDVLQALFRLLTDGALRRRLAEAARARATAEYSMQAFRARFAEAFGRG